MAGGCGGIPEGVVAIRPIASGDEARVKAMLEASGLLSPNERAKVMAMLADHLR